MTKTKKILLYERRETWRLMIGEKKFGDDCGICREPVEWLTADRAAVILGLSERELFRLAEVGRIHLSGSLTAGVRFCGPSLLAEAAIEKNTWRKIQNE